MRMHILNSEKFTQCNYTKFCMQHMDFYIAEFF